MKSLNKFPSKTAAIFDPDLYAFDVRQQVAAPSPYEGDVGIEIELEGVNLPQHYAGPETNGVTWTWHNDGSLRNGGAEYVLSQPCKRADLPKLLDDLFAFINAHPGTAIRNSTRCSTHVHVNMRGMKLNQIAAFVALYGTFENMLAAHCGPVRNGNLFALRLCDSSYAVDGWTRCFKSGEFEWPNEMRYLALNPAALRRFGSLESRLMGGVTSGDDVIDFVDALLRLRELAVSKAYRDPADIALRLSALGGRGFFDEVFEGLAIKSRLEQCGEDVEMSVREGFRLVQPIVYSVSWTHALPEIEKVFIPNPFGASKPRKRRSLREETEALAMPEFN